ncbi:MAG: class I SAM-dependent methyltransferase [Methylocystis sp.]
MLQRAEAINYFITRFGYTRYLEIGVEAGVTFNEVNAAEKTAVDPHFKVARDVLRGVSFETTSDVFFDNNPRAEFDLIFIDGLHTFEQSLRDFISSLSRLSENGLILIDDCCPSDYLASLRDHSLCQNGKSLEGSPDRNWMGDVYKTILFIGDYFDGVSFSYIDETMGIVAIWKERRETAKRFATIEEIYRCEFARFKYELAPTVPITALPEIGNRIDALKAA